MDSLLELFCDVDDFCETFEPIWNQQQLSSGEKKRQRNRSLTLSEIMTILIAFHQSHYRDFKAYYCEQVSKNWHKEFPGLVSYTRFVEYIPSAVIPLIGYLRMCCLGHCSGISFIDSTSLDVCLNQRIHSHKVFAGLAGRGKTSTGWFYGFKLHLVVNDQGEILRFCLTPGNIDDRKPVPHLARNLFGKLFGDKRYISQPLAQFETTMSFASAEDANPDIFGALVSQAFDFGVGKLAEHFIPGLSTVKDFLDATTEELERAGKASQSFKVGNWIKDQRAAISNQLLQDTVKSKRDLLQADTESDFLDQDKSGRQKFFDLLHQANEGLSGPIDISIDELEMKFYEQWINAHFTEIGEDVPGCIEYRLEFLDNEFDLESCTVQAPFGDKIDSALNRLLDRGQLPGVRRPIDFKVRKRVCLFTENFVGGKSWFWGWLDQDNTLLHQPVHPEAQKGMRETVWRISTKRFAD